MPCIFIKLKGGKVARAHVRGRVTAKEAAALLDQAEAAYRAVDVEFTPPKRKPQSLRNASDKPDGES